MTHVKNLEILFWFEIVFLLLLRVLFCLPLLGARVSEPQLGYGVEHMPVVDDNKLDGMISMRDIVQIRIVDLEREVEDLKTQ